jgi:hypothetical protein
MECKTLHTIHIMWEREMMVRYLGNRVEERIRQCSPSWQVLDVFEDSVRHLLTEGA